MICDFGSGSLLQTCGWTVPADSHPKMRWRTGQGAQAFWMGGPPIDHTLADSSGKVNKLKINYISNFLTKTLGGYAYFETSYTRPPASKEPLPKEKEKPTIDSNLTSLITGSQSQSTNTLLRPLISKFPIFQPNEAKKLAEIPPPNSAFFFGPNITDSGPQGLCLSFFYYIDGLSSDRIRVHIRDIEAGTNRTIWESIDNIQRNWTKGEVVYTYGAAHKVIVFKTYSRFKKF